MFEDYLNKKTQVSTVFIACVSVFLLCMVLYHINNKTNPNDEDEYDDREGLEGFVYCSDKTM